MLSSSFTGLLMVVSGATIISLQITLSLIVVVTYYNCNKVNNLNLNYSNMYLALKN